jgi:hypothetical protein
MLLTEYLLMFLLVCNTSKHGGKRKRYKNFEALIFAFAEAAKIIGIKTATTGVLFMNAEITR